MCLSALAAAGRHEQLLSLLDLCPYPSWTYRQWGVKALVAMGKRSEALHYAEATQGRNEPLGHIAEACESILLSSGLADEAYQRYARVANRAGTYLATFRAICRKYPHKQAEDVLNDLVASTPGDEGKWFAAAKDAKLYDLALKLAQRSPVDHRTLLRSAQDFVLTEPQFALNSGLLALYWICAGRAYEATVGEVQRAYDLTPRRRIRRKVRRRHWRGFNRFLTASRRNVLLWVRWPRQVGCRVILDRLATELLGPLSAITGRSK